MSALTCGVLLVSAIPAPAVFYTYIEFGDGNFNDPNNFFPFGTPGPDDFVEFAIPFTVTVTFPGGSIFDPPVNYTTEHLRVRGDNITFSGSSLPFRGPSAYIVDSPIQTDSNRGIIISEFSGDNGVLNISDSGIACCGGLSSLSSVAATIGDQAGANGTLNVTNGGSFNVTGSDFTQTQLIIGNRGTGTLSLSNGSDVNVPGSNAHASLGRFAGGSGTVNISGAGSTWTINDRLSIGENGTGTLTVQNGGQLVTTGSGGLQSTILGTFTGAQGTVSITGAGSRWTNGSTLRVGNSGNGTLTISNGGSLLNTNGNIASIGGGFGVSGSATVAGAGSTWQTPGQIRIEALGWRRRYQRQWRNPRT
jgi:T5SS/PEP-CTERM-associated repeat protein